MPVYDIAIIGSGIMGAAAACEAARMGAKVALIDQGTLPNPRASSIDHSKVFRFAYPDPLYARMAVESLQLWRALEEETRETLLTQTGILMIGENWPSYETETYETLRSLSLDAEMLDSREAAARFPQFNSDRFPYAVYDPSGAILHAERAVRALIALARSRGVKVIEGKRVMAIKRGDSGRATALVSEAGSVFECERALVASGAWSRMLVPILEGLLSPTRQELFYFEPVSLETDINFDAGKFPIFTSLETGFYGFPIHHAGAMKIANHNKGEKADPRSFDDRVSEESIAGCRAFFADFIPGLRDARLQKTGVCIYNNTPDDDFLIDWHPEFENVLIATGFSGHGFKFGSLIGRIASELLLTGHTSQDIKRFNFARFDRV